MKIERTKGNDFIEIHGLIGKIKGLVQHPAHIYKIMIDYFGNSFFITRDSEKSENKIIGFMLGFKSQVDDSFFVWQVGVSETAQGRGLGKKLIERTIEFAKNENCGSVRATVETDNIPSQKLFESFGFEVATRKIVNANIELIETNGKIAAKNYYGSGTDQIYYELIL